MSASFLTATVLRRDDSLILAAATPTILARTLSEQLTLTQQASAAPPALRRAPSSTSTAPHAATLLGTFSFGVCDHLDDVYDLGRLAQASSLLRDEVRQLERTWMRACIEACAGLDWWYAEGSDGSERLFDGSLASWQETFGAMMACRDELINNGPLWGPSMGQANDDSCETVPWGERPWNSNPRAVAEPPCARSAPAHHDGFTEGRTFGSRPGR